VLDQAAGDAEIPADGLADAQAVKRPGHVVGDGVGDGPVQLVAPVERCDEVVSFPHRIQDVSDPLRFDGDEVRIEDGDGLRFEEVRRLENGAQSGSLSRDAPVDRDDLLDVEGGNLDKIGDLPRVIRRSAVGYQDDRTAFAAVFRQTGGDGVDDVGDRSAAVIGGDADDDVGLSQLFESLSDVVPQRSHETGRWLHRSTSQGVRCPPSSERRRATTAFHPRLPGKGAMMRFGRSNSSRVPSGRGINTG